MVRISLSLSLNLSSLPPLTTASTYVLAWWSLLPAHLQMTQSCTSGTLRPRPSLGDLWSLHISFSIAARATVHLQSPGLCKVSYILYVCVCMYVFGEGVHVWKDYHNQTCVHFSLLSITIDIKGNIISHLSIPKYYISRGITRIFSLPEGYKGKYYPYFPPSGYYFDQSLF